jgi:hypothetical protein
VNIPEVNLYNEQKIKIITPSKKCPSPLKTLYFTSNLIDYKEKGSDNVKTISNSEIIITINLSLLL